MYKSNFKPTFDISGDVKVDGYINGFKVGDIMNATEELKKKTHHDLDKLKATSGPICAQLKVFMNLSGKPHFFSSDPTHLLIA